MGAWGRVGARVFARCATRGIAWRSITRAGILGAEPCATEAWTRVPGVAGNAFGRLGSRRAFSDGDGGGASRNKPLEPFAPGAEAWYRGLSPDGKRSLEYDYHDHLKRHGLRSDVDAATGDADILSMRSYINLKHKLWKAVSAPSGDGEAEEAKPFYPDSRPKSEGGAALLNRYREGFASVAEPWGHKSHTDKPTTVDDDGARLRNVHALIKVYSGYNNTLMVSSHPMPPGGCVASGSDPRAPRADAPRVLVPMRFLAREQTICEAGSGSSLRSGGRVRAVVSGGTCGFRKAARGTFQAAEVVGERTSRVAHEMGFRLCGVDLRGPNRRNRRNAFRGLTVGNRLKITEVWTSINFPHNGCRPPKKRRL